MTNSDPYRDKLEEKRKMLTSAIKKVDFQLQHPDVQALSRELDDLILQYIAVIEKKRGCS